jgi:hypothetical protein
MKYIIKLQDGKYVEQFFKSAVCVTNEINKAGKYTKSIANKRIENLKIKAVLINANL